MHIIYCIIKTMVSISTTVYYDIKSAFHSMMTIMMMAQISSLLSFHSIGTNGASLAGWQMLRLSSSAENVLGMREREREEW